MYFKKSKRAGAEEARARTPVPGTLGRGGYAEFIPLLWMGMRDTPEGALRRFPSAS